MNTRQLRGGADFGWRPLCQGRERMKSTFVRFWIRLAFLVAVLGIMSTAADRASAQEKIISDNADAIFRSPLSHVAGDPNGDVTVVEFFDYNCGYCRLALPYVVKLVNDDRKIRL